MPTSMPAGGEPCRQMIVSTPVSPLLRVTFSLASPPNAPESAVPAPYLTKPWTQSAGYLESTYSDINIYRYD
jgi:hypothetical protein